MAKRSNRRRKKARNPNNASGRPRLTKPALYADVYEQDIWASLRQGACNAAGVRFQIAVAVHVLAMSRAGEMPFQVVVPEGYEDIDATGGDGQSWFIQVKEVGAGAGRFTAAPFVDAVLHAKESVPADAKIVLVTDGILGGDLEESGLQSPVYYDRETPSKIVNLLADRGVASSAVKGLLARTHLVRLPWNLAEVTAKVLGDVFELHPAVAAVAYCTLVEDLSSATAEQRSARASEPVDRTLGDLETTISALLDVVNVESLEEAVRSGICVHADYSSEAAITRSQFLAGIDAVPNHIGANYDVVRPAELLEIRTGMESARYVLLAGPSGAGKSTLLWRAARDLSRGARVVRVLRSTLDDVEALLRYVRLQRPSEMSPVIVACDDLGRPSTAAWPEVVRRLLEVPHVLMIGASRSEDVTPQLMRHGGVLVEIRIGERQAQDIADQLKASGIELFMEPDEAISKADGHLMEYLALITTGSRIRAVIAEQVHQLFADDEADRLDIARLICAADVLGVDIPAQAIGRQASSSINMRSALSQLSGEHIVTRNGESWSGLHQRRSAEITTLIHETPPPSRADTFAEVASCAAPEAAGWSIRRAVETLGGDSEALVDTARDRVKTLNGAGDLAAFLEQLERSDATVTALRYKPILERHLKPSVPLMDWAMLVFAHKFGASDFADNGNEQLAKGFRAIRACSAELPDSYVQLSKAAITAAGPSQIVALMCDSSIGEALRLAEACEDFARLDLRDVAQIAVAHAWPDGLLSADQRSLYSRLTSSVASMCVAVQDLSEFGTLSLRAERVANSHPNIVDISLESSDSEVVVSVRLLPESEGEYAIASQPWDLGPRPDDYADLINDQAVEIADLVLTACPDVDFAEVHCIDANGNALMMDGREHGYKKLTRKSLPRDKTKRRSVALMAALSRTCAANSWTALARERASIAADILELLSTAPRRLGAEDHPGRRQDWKAAARSTKLRHSGLQRLPDTESFDGDISAAKGDSFSRKEDQLVKLLRRVVDELERLVPGPEGKLIPLAVESGLAKFARELTDTLNENNELLLGGERQTYEEIVPATNRLTGMLRCIEVDPSVSTRIRGAPDEFASMLDALIENVSEAQLDRERITLGAVFEDLPLLDLLHVAQPGAYGTAIAEHQWLVQVDVEHLQPALALLGSWDGVDWPQAGPRVTLCSFVNGVMLPTTFRHSPRTASGYLPIALDSNDSSPLALSWPIASGPLSAIVGGIQSAALRLSLEAARRNLRADHRPRSTIDFESELRTLREQVVAIGDTSDIHLLLRQRLSGLLDRLEGELAESGSDAIAAFATSIDFIADEAPLESELLTTLGEITLLALDIDLAVMD